MKKSGHLLLCGGVIILVLLLVVMYRRGREGFDTQCPNSNVCKVEGETCSHYRGKSEPITLTCVKKGPNLFLTYKG